MAKPIAIHSPGISEVVLDEHKKRLEDPEYRQKLLDSVRIPENDRDVAELIGGIYTLHGRESELPVKEELTALVMFAREDTQEMEDERILSPKGALQGLKIKNDLMEIPYFALATVLSTYVETKAMYDSYGGMSHDEAVERFSKPESRWSLFHAVRLIVEDELKHAETAGDYVDTAILTIRGISEATRFALMSPERRVEMTMPPKNFEDSTEGKRLFYVVDDVTKKLMDKYWDDDTSL